MSKKLGNISKWFVLIVAGLITVWDIFAQLTGGTSATISFVLWEWSSEDNHILPFAFGLLMGHLFWQVEKPVTSLSNEKLNLRLKMLREERLRRLEE